MSSGIKYLQIQQPTWAVYSVRAVWWQQQWWWDWGLLWKNVPAKGALGSSRDNSFIVKVCRSYCRILEQVGPFFNEHFNKCWKVVRWTAYTGPSWVCFNNETWGQAEDVQLVLLLKSVSLWSDKHCIKSSLQVCEMWALMFLYVKQSGRRQSWHEEEAECQGSKLGDEWTFLLSSLREGMASTFVYTSYPF